MRMFLLAVSLLAGPMVLSAEPERTSAQPGTRPNVLFICVDDLRPQLGAYGLPTMQTPNLDQLAAEGRLFRRHYVQVPTCGASRYALLTGLYPVAPRAYRNDAFRLLNRPDAPTTMAHHFRQHGYFTKAIGKVSHTPGGGTPPEMPGAWNESTAPSDKWGDPESAFFGYSDGSGRVRGESPPMESTDVPDTGYPDGLIAEAAVKALEESRDREQPFLLALGFYKPHLPFNSPRRYWDLYQRDEIDLPPWRQPPTNTDPEISMHGSGEFFGNYGGHPEDARTSDEYARHIRHAYFAATSYVNAQIGKVLDAVDRLGLRGNTIIVVWGDHGWHLGDHGLWGKHSPYERALHSAFIVRVPGQSQPGEATDAIIESVDIFPTLAELCDLPAPADIDGHSFAAVVSDPSVPGEAAFGFWRQRNFSARTVRTDRYRLIVWSETGPEGRPIQFELYDHQIDPDESRNVAAGNESIVSDLMDRLRVPPR